MPMPAHSQAKPAASRLRPGSEQERAQIHEALVRNHQNVTRAAADLGVSRVTFYRMVKRLGEDLKALRAEGE